MKTNHKQKTCQCASCKSKRGESIGKNSGNWKGGNPKCIKCQILLSRRDAILCSECYIKSITKGVKSTCKICGIFLTQKHCKLCRKCYDKSRLVLPRYCIDCKKSLQKHGKSKRCYSCSNKMRIVSLKTRLKISISHKKLKLTGKRCHMFGKPPTHGKRMKYKGIWMRSTWEVKYAKYLDRRGTKWLYESKTFDLGEVSYTPDFYLPEINTYIEIKGYWRDDAKLKFDLFKSKYSGINIQILNKLNLQSLKIL